MNSKRSLSQAKISHKRQKTVDWTDSYFYKTLEQSGIKINHPPEKCVSSQETVHIIRNIKKNMQKAFDHPRNVLEFFSNLEQECQDWDVFKHYLFPNIVRLTADSQDERLLSDSVIKILLSVPIIQEKLLDFIFEKATELAAESKCGPWIQMILKCICSLDSVINTEKVSTNLINLLDVTSETLVKLEIITAMPDIIGDQEHNDVALELSRILSEDHNLIPAILDCLSYLCLSDDQYEQLQKKTLHILMTLSKCNYFPNFIKFLLIPGRISDNAYLEAVQGLRNSLGWPATMMKAQDIASSQALTATAIRNSMISSKVIANSWYKVVAANKTSAEYKPFDFIILLILYSISEDRQRQVENLLRKQIKLNIFKEDMLTDVFEKFKLILRNNLKTLIDLTNTLLKTKTDPVIESFGSHMYMNMFSELEDSRQTIVAEILQLGLDCKQCVLNILLILNNVAKNDMSLLKPHSLQMLTLLDRMDDMTLSEIRAVMNLLCGLAYSYENSVIRDDLHIIIRKELSSSSPIIKIQGIFAGVHAVKYLMASTAHEDNSVDLPDDVSYSSVTYLSEGDLREAAQIIELISRSTRQFPDLIAFFYDELSKVISTTSHINKHFLSWLTDAVTNDLQQKFIVDIIERDEVGELKLLMRYCLNADSEMDEVIAINIAGLTLQPKDEISVGILSPLFQLVQILHSRQHNGDLSSIDALLGCPIIMPSFDVDLIEDMDHNSISNILDCLIHCVNWLRELLNAFADQEDDALKTKILKRVSHVEELENSIGKILIKSKINYKPPVCVFNLGKYTGETTEKKPTKAQIAKQNKKLQQNGQDETILPETARSQVTQNNSVKEKLGVLCNLPLRQLNLKILHLLTNEISSNQEADNTLSFGNFNFLLKCINNNIQNILVSRIKKKTFLSKPVEDNVYDPETAENCAKHISKMLPKIMEHVKFFTSYMENHLPHESHEDTNLQLPTELYDYVSSLENLYIFLTIYFKWIGFRNHHVALLKSSLRTVANVEEENLISLKDLILGVAKFLQKHEKFCLQLSTAVALIDFLTTIEEYSESTTVRKILRGMAQNFLSRIWRSPDGIQEKGLIFNQSVDKLASIYFINNEIIHLKNLSFQLTNEIKVLKGRNDTLSEFKCINKSNFPVLYRNLGTALFEATKSQLSKSLPGLEQLTLWKDVAMTLKYMSDIAKTLDNRNNLSAFFKKSLPILKLFSTQGIPVLEMQFKKSTDEILELLKIIQQSTRFLQSLCCHSRLKKDNVLMSKVPFMRQLLETLIYKVKAVLAANKCSEAFWMGNLKNKNIHGEIISTQQSIESEETVEDCDDQLPDDDDETDDELLNPDSRSVSDII